MPCGGVGGAPAIICGGAPIIDGGAPIAGGGAAILLLTVALGNLDPAVPTVPRAGVLVDSVRRGDVVRAVRGPGTLVPEHIRWITAQASARVERLVAVSGQSVTPDMVLLEM